MKTNTLTKPEEKQSGWANNSARSGVPPTSAHYKAADLTGEVNQMQITQLMLNPAAAPNAPAAAVPAGGGAAAVPAPAAGLNPAAPAFVPAAAPAPAVVPAAAPAPAVVPAAVPAPAAGLNPAAPAFVPAAAPAPAVVPAAVPAPAAGLNPAAPAFVPAAAPAPAVVPPYPAIANGAPVAQGIIAQIANVPPAAAGYNVVGQWHHGFEVWAHGHGFNNGMVAHFNIQAVGGGPMLHVYYNAAGGLEVVAHGQRPNGY